MLLLMLLAIPSRYYIRLQGVVWSIRYRDRPRCISSDVCNKMDVLVLSDLCVYLVPIR